MVDWPGGRSVDGRSPADVPHPIVAASTFDPEFGGEFETTVAREADEANQDVLLTPTTDHFRIPAAEQDRGDAGGGPAWPARWRLLTRIQIHLLGVDHQGRCLREVLSIYLIVISILDPKLLLLTPFLHYKTV